MPDGGAQTLSTTDQVEPAARSPRMESVTVRDHSPYEGLIESENGDWINMILLKRHPGQPLHLVVRPIARRDVLSIERIEPAQRSVLQEEIEQFRNHAAIEAGRMEAVVLTAVDRDGVRYQHYAGKWFTLDSTADEPSTRRVIVRAEQIFAAYRQLLPPRIAPVQIPRLAVFGSLSEYQACLARYNLKIQNRACYLEDKNLVLIGSELSRLATIMAKVVARNEQLRKELSELEKRFQGRMHDVAERLKKDGLSSSEMSRTLVMERRRFDEQGKRLRQELAQSDREVAVLFNQNTAQTFVRLYHESFHAYLRNYVYPRQTFDVPSWLNEGLAVMFESGLLEGTTLRVDAPNPAALKKLKQYQAGGETLPLDRLLAAGPADFLLTADVAPAAVDRYYAHAWALAYYLTFEKRLLRDPALDRYLRAGSGGTSVQRFEQLVGKPAAEFADEWRKYVATLK